MMLSYRERRKILKQVNTLELTPVKLYPEECGKDGLVTLFVPRFRNKAAKKFIVPRLKSSEFKIKLDELGSAVWMNMDGVKNVSDIIRSVSEKFGDKIQPAVERVSKFIFQLYEQKLISFNELN